ncbi:beta-1,4-mannosyltransferase egh [Schistocerca americana]|uniref:beta-1,4-mannosyltransferase egh n=1 Tax=Schistocerca americana TaxID=7009 RepID=UPI001F4FF0A2|nr:beta-1,4-mannosyltransferase egh [Schistocerca americana]XP_047003887.1 beta-1,4-mannosyltransferase egh [Schistocerca americana]XP_047003888.1 beta-1,4-mannosyltransferase egh [Schistocerca americana]XP_049937493.1 beta-1,4-mannosyltransferase egh [Schistocerca serialis cubense]
MLSSRTKHILHCCLLLTVIAIFEICTGGIRLGSDKQQDFDPWERYGYFGAFSLYLIRLLTFLPLPQVLFNFAGLTLYNAFPDKVPLKGSPLLAPFICIRVVTRGDYPQLVRNNVARNMTCCTEAGLENFLIEVVTDKVVGLANHRRVREVVVPATYRPKSGALFKARALQYCLEDGVNILADNDWVVHLDEETLLTENSVRGILNFVLDGKHQFGQGLITYANEDVVNWVTTLADSFRVADDMGKLRLQFSMFHKPLFSWKGSYVVTQVGAERQVSFDNGPDGSVAEDCFFAMRAYTQGYSFNFVEGEMWEKSPFSLWDFMQQRKRWLQGILLVVHSQAIPLRHKWLLAVSCYSWVTMPLSTSNVLLAGLCPIPCPPLMDFACAFIGAVNIYMYVFGVVKSFSLYRFGMLRFLMCICGALSTIPFNIIIENVAVVLGLFGQKHRFYVVNKEFRPPITV